MKAFLALTLVGLASSTAQAHPVSWTQQQIPFRIYAHSYYVGSRGLSAVLIDSGAGLVLIDGTLPENAALVEGNIRALGFRVEDIKIILNTHPHPDHAGAIAALAHDSGARVIASAQSAWALQHGGNDPNDPQLGLSDPFPAVPQVRVLTAGEQVTLGSLRLTMHPMPGHTVGGTGWSWTACQQGQCAHMVFADSISLLSNPTYRYTDPAQPQRLAGFRATIAMLRQIPCDILIAPHPDSIGFLDKLARQAAGKPNPWLDRGACKAYADMAQENLQQRLDDESAAAAHRS